MNTEMDLSVFDGMHCAGLALMSAGVERLPMVVSEIDKYAVKTVKHNFPDVVQLGDIFSVDFTQYKGKVRFLFGGSPCTHWSIAQTKNRETEASGIGWDLFSQYVRAWKEAEPKYFIYENNKSMSSAIRESITATFGFEPICINSALVSAQNRQRLYWVGIRQADGTYKKCDVKQPTDRGILLRDILEGAIALKDKSHAVISSAGRTTEREYFIKNQGEMATEPLSNKGMEHMLRPVKDGMITIKGRQYPIKLVDGYYIIRKLTVRECMRLQTVPEWYEFPVSNSQAYKMLGNGWTIEVIAHLIKSVMEETNEL